MDKAVLSRFGLSSSGLSLFVGGNQLVLATVVLLIVPLESPGRNAILGGLGAGAFQGLGLALMFYMLKREDVSRVIPIFQTSPIFVFMLALVFLDESLSLLQWLAVFLAVAGAVLAATKRSEVSGALRPSPAFAVLFLAAAAVGVSQLLVKVTTDDVSVLEHGDAAGIRDGRNDGAHLRPAGHGARGWGVLQATADRCLAGGV